jgi:predicted RNA methylase
VVDPLAAAFVDDLFDFGASLTLVAMNPPFASSAARSADPEIARGDLVSVLKRLSPGARLAAITRAGFSAGGAAPASRAAGRGVPPARNLRRA